MTTILYIHGFLSSPQSKKAEVSQHWLRTHRPEATFICPQLSSYPRECWEQLLRCIDSIPPEELNLIGSSMGGFWANLLVETQRARKAVLINPAVKPGTLFASLVGEPLKHYYLDEEVCLAEGDIRYLCDCEAAPPIKPMQYWVMLQTGDKTLDYRLAAEKYQRCNLYVEDGGNHAFCGYEKWLPKISEFFET